MPSTARYVAHDETQDHVTYVYVLEVLLDECSPVLPLPNPNAGLNPVPPALNREQRWTPLALFRNAAGTAVAFCNAFEASNVQAGTMRGMNLSLDASKGVANVAKLYGFGRRV